MKIEFANSKPLETRLTYVSNDIELPELRVIIRLSQFDESHQCGDLVFDVHGRSILLKSPSKIHLTNYDEFVGNFGSIQIIGCGGDMDNLKSGVMLKEESRVIRPPTSKNVNDVIGRIGELREFTRCGKFETRTREYMPQRGMDKKEAENRKRNTRKILEDIVLHSQTKGTSAIQVPRLIAEGIYPELLDPNGEPLCFQAYRVPTQRRFPQSLIEFHLKQDSDFERVSEYIQQFGYRVGSLLSVLHNHHIAYMDCHAGNLDTLVNSSGKMVLYATDLGSFEEIDSRNPFAYRYRGFDKFMFFHSVNSYFRALDESGITGVSFEEVLMPYLLCGFNESYKLCDENIHFQSILNLIKRRESMLDFADQIRY